MINLKFDNIGEKYNDHLYLISRILIGFLFFSIGAQRLLGWFGGQETAVLFSLAGLAGLIELVGGLMILIGLFVRPVALVGAIYMIIEYIRSHASVSIIPRVNNGEVEVLLFASFLLFILLGSGKWSLEKMWFKKNNRRKRK